MNKTFVVFTIFLTLLVFSCGNSPTEPKEAHFSVTDFDKETGLYDSPHIRLYVINDGNATGYNITCTIMLFDSDGKVLRGNDLLIYSGDVKSGESFWRDIVLTVDSHDDYANVTFSLMWNTK